MRKNLKKLWFVFSMALVLAFVGGGCNKTESLDNRVAQTDSQTESEEEGKVKPQKIGRQKAKRRNILMSKRQKLKVKIIQSMRRK